MKQIFFFLFVLSIGPILFSCSSDDGPPPDTTPPQVSIISPASGVEVSGIIIVQVLATDDNAVTSVNFLVDGLIRETTQFSPYDFEWDTDLFADGQLHAWPRPSAEIIQ